MLFENNSRTANEGFKLVSYPAYINEFMTPEESVKDIYNDLGCFTYTDDGFTIIYESFSKSIKWSEITELIAFKTDLLTTDRIDLHIVYGEKYFTISEEFPGWYQFVIRINSLFPSISQTWDTDIVFPAFAENRTIIYHKE